MKGFVIPLTGAIFVILLASTIQSVDADHVEEFGQGIFKDEFLVNFTPTKDTKWIMHLQVEIRNAQNQLVTLTETVYGYHIPHEITDYTFDEMLGKKEIVTIDNIKYEKATYSAKPPMEELISEYNRPKHFNGNWQLKLCAVLAGHDYVCIPVFHANTAFLPLEISDVVTTHWTVLRVMN